MRNHDIDMLLYKSVPTGISELPEKERLEIVNNCFLSVFEDFIQTLSRNHVDLIDMVKYIRDKANRHSNNYDNLLGQCLTLALEAHKEELERSNNDACEKMRAILAKRSVFSKHNT